MENQNKEILENEGKVVEEEKETQLEQSVEENAEEKALEVVEEQQEEVAEEEVPYEGKEVTTSIRYDYKTMKYFNMYNTVVRRKLPLWYLILAIIAAGFGIFNIVDGIIRTYVKVQEDFNITSSLIFGGIFLFFAVYLLFQSIRFESFVDRTITNHFMSHKVAEQHIRIREDKITLIPVNKPEESFSYDWAQITSIEEINEYFFLYIGRSPLIIDKDPGRMIDGTYEQMEELFKEKIEIKPYKRYTKQVVKNPITFVHKEDIENEANAVEVEAVVEETQEQENNDQN